MDPSLEPYLSYQLSVDQRFLERLDYNMYFLMRRISQLHDKVDKMSAETDALRSAANSLMTSVDAAVVALAKLIAGQANPADAAAVVAVTTDLTSKSQALTAALTAVPA